MAESERLCLKVDTTRCYYVRDELNREVRRAKVRKAESVNEVHKNVKCILMSEKEELTVSEFLNVYSQLLYTPFPHREFSFDSAADMLRTFGDILTLKKEGDDWKIIVRDSVKETHIYKLVAAQLPPRPKEQPFPDEGKYYLGKSIIPFPAQDAICEILWDCPRGLPENKFYDLFKTMVPVKLWEIDVGPRRMADSIPHLIRVDNGRVFLMRSVKLSDFSEVLTLHPEQITLPIKRVGKYEKSIGRNLDELLAKEHKMSFDEIPSRYKKVFRRDLPLYQCGFRNVWHFLCAIPGKFAMLPCDETFLLESHKYMNDEDWGTDIRQYNPEVHCGVTAKEIMIKEIMNLVASRPDGVNVKHLPLIYEVEYLKKIVIRDSVVKFFKDLGALDAFDVIKERGNFMVKPRRGRVLQDVFLPQRSFVAPRDAALGCNRFPQIPNLPVRMLMEFEILHIEDDDLFYVHTNHQDGKTNFVFLSNIDCMLKTFYLKNYSTFWIKNIQAISQGMPVAVIWKGQWHRGLVLNTSSCRGEAKVFAVDKGFTVIVKSVDLCYLHKRFVGITPRALKATGNNMREKLGDLLRGIDRTFKARLVDKKGDCHFIEMQ